MAKDGLMPGLFGKVHPKHRTPYIGTVIVGTVPAAMAGLFPIGFLGDMVSMGPLPAFATVSAAVLILRPTRPDVPPPFPPPMPVVLCPLAPLPSLLLFSHASAPPSPPLLGWLPPPPLLS